MIYVKPHVIVALCWMLARTATSCVVAVLWRRMLRTCHTPFGVLHGAGFACVPCCLMGSQSAWVPYPSGDSLTHRLFKPHKYALPGITLTIRVSHIGMALATPLPQVPFCFVLNANFYCTSLVMQLPIRPEVVLLSWSGLCWVPHIGASGNLAGNVIFIYEKYLEPTK